MKKCVLALALAGVAIPAFATDGYFAHGYGMTAYGMGGAATAMSEDAFGGANNPASMVWVGNRLDLGAYLFAPRRSAERSNSSYGGAFDGSADSDLKYFVIPEFGYNRMINSDLSLGVTVYGNGGMNTYYPSGQLDGGICTTGKPNGSAANLLCGSGRLGVNLMQLVVAPTLAYKLNANNSIGVSPLFGYQRFKAYGVQAFIPMSSDAANVTNNGADHASGWGVRVGWQGHITPSLTLGAAYSSKISMGSFDKYRGLFAEQGGFDIPENYSAGLAFKATPELTVALDYERINYDGVASISNPSTNMAPLGSNNGPGFGWDSVNVWKLGFEYKYSHALTLRAGYNHTDNPIRSRDVTFNILAPGVPQDHLTLGLSYAVNKTSDLTLAYMHAFKHSVSGQDPFFGGTDKIEMYQNSLGVAYSWKM